MQRRHIAHVVIASLALITSPAISGPNQAELRSYRALVPDWSKTSGGSSPAVSPDGKTVVYLAADTSRPGSNYQAWTISVAEGSRTGSDGTVVPSAPPDAWRLGSIPAEPVPGARRSMLIDTYRDADWSPDGKQVVFALNDKLYVAKDIDPVRRTASTTLIADSERVQSEPSRDAGGGPRDDRPTISSPRWSPDGRKIAYILANGIQPGGVVRVHDVAGGTGTTIASDAYPGPEVWDQPWSPDGRSLVYTSVEHSPDGASWIIRGIVEVSVAAKQSSLIVKGAMSMSPTWSKASGRIAFSAPGRGGVAGAIFRVWQMDGPTRQPKAVTSYAAPQADADAARSEMRRLLRGILADRYHLKLSPELARMLNGKDLSDNDAPAVLMLAVGFSTAEEFGGRFGRTIGEARKSLYSGGRLDSKRLLRLGARVSGALIWLTAEQRAEFQGRLTADMARILKPLMRVQGQSDLSPVWSPDGKSIAFVRYDMVTGARKLMVQPVQGGTPCALFADDSVGCVQWTRDGRRLILEAKRNLARDTRQPEDGLWPNAIVMPSYPEIWLIEPN